MKKVLIFIFLLLAVALGVYFFVQKDRADEMVKTHPFDAYPSKEEYRKLTHEEGDVIIRKFIAEHSPDLAWEYLKYVSVEGDEIVIDPHIPAHSIGNSLFNSYGVAGLSVCTQEFAFGCHHGVLEEFLRTMGSEHIAEAEVACMEAFPDFTTTQERLFGECIHGIGHGILSWEGYDIDAALTYCERFKTVINQIDCSAGVFMENSDFGPAPVLGDTDDVWETCRGLPSKYQIQCGLYHPSLLKRVFKFSQEEIVAACMNAPTEILRESCTKHMGAKAVRKSPQDIESIRKDCAMFTDESFEFDCIKSAAAVLVYYEFTDWELYSSELCNAYSNEQRSECFSYRDKTVEKYVF